MQISSGCFRMCILKGPISPILLLLWKHVRRARPKGIAIRSQARRLCTGAMMAGLRSKPEYTLALALFLDEVTHRLLSIRAPRFADRDVGPKAPAQLAALGKPRGNMHWSVLGSMFTSDVLKTRVGAVHNRVRTQSLLT